MKKYRSAKGRLVDWTALAQTTVPVEQREVTRKAAPDAAPKSRMIGGHVPAAAEEVVEEVVETKSTKGKKKPAEPEVAEEEATPPSE